MNASLNNLRYLRKEKISKLSDTKIIIPDCIRRISNFGADNLKAHVSAQADQIIIVAGGYNANAIIKSGILEIPHELFVMANMANAEVLSLYLSDLNTIIVLTSIIESKQPKTDSDDDTDHAQFRLDDNHFVAENASEKIMVHFSRIYYFEKIKSTRNTCVVFVGGISTFKSDLKEVLEKLDDGFVQCHKAFIANMTRVVKFDKKQNLLIFDNHYYCPCSRIYKGAVMDWKF